MIFTYIYKKDTHTDISSQYMTNLGMDEEQIYSVLQQYDFELKKARQRVHTECEKRIQKKWSKIGQINAALGIYEESEIQSCKQCIDTHRASCNKLLAREDLLEINYTGDEFWPS